MSFVDTQEKKVVTPTEYTFSGMLDMTVPRVHRWRESTALRETNNLGLLTPSALALCCYF